MRLKNSESKKSKGCCSILSDTYKDFAENTSIHGLKYTVKREIGIYEKFFWILVVVSGLCGAVYMTVLFWQRYTSNPTRTTILTDFAPTTTVPFPAITICNINRIMESKIDEFMTRLALNDSEKPIIKSALPQLLAFMDPTAVAYNMTELNLLQEVLERNDYGDMSRVMNKIGQRCDEMVLNCYLNKKNTICSDVFKESLTTEGVCCSFNYHLMGKHEDLYNAYSGIGTGLRAILKPIRQKTQYSTLYTSGFKIIIHSPTDYPGIQSNSKIVSVGRLSYLQILGTAMTCSEDVKNLPVNQRQCLYRNERSLRNFPDEYNDSNCLTECDANYYFQLCGCVPFFFFFTDKPLCNISNIPCLHNMKKNVSFKGAGECDCPSQCEDVFYNVMSSTTTFNYETSMSMMSIGSQYLTEDYVVLNVFFIRNGQKVLLRDTITSTVYLLSSFGGVYSLFMGCSLITIVEVIYYGLFRFVVNMKLFGKVDVDGEESTKQKQRHIKRHFNFKDDNRFQVKPNFPKDVFLP